MKLGQEVYRVQSESQASVKYSIEKLVVSKVITVETKSESCCTYYDETGNEIGKDVHEDFSTVMSILKDYLMPTV
jgi:hypothetical protein